MAQTRNASLFTAELIVPAIRDAFVKLDPRQLIRNPVMFTTAVVAVLLTVLLAVGQDNQLIMAANEELIQKLQAAETEASRLNRSVGILRSELQTQTTTASK